MLSQTGGKRGETLMGHCNLFSHRRYMNGAATNPDFHVLSHAGAQVKAALDATIALGGENYVFWGGREGYMSLPEHQHETGAGAPGPLSANSRDYAVNRALKALSS